MDTKAGGSFISVTRRILFVLAVIAGQLTMLCGCSIEKDSGGTIQGTILDAETSEGLSDVTVELIYVENNRTLQTRASGDNGIYSFGGLSVGEYQLKFSKTGYEDLYLEVSVSGAISIPTGTSYMKPIKKLTIVPSYLTYSADDVQKTLTLTNEGTGAVQYQITPSNDWISIEPASGTVNSTPVTVTITVNDASLTKSSNIGSVNITVVNTTTEFMVPVTCNVNMATVTAAVSGVGGSISPDGITEVRIGGKQKYTVTPDAGYIIDQVLIDGVNNALAVSSGSYTFDEVVSNHTIVASFRQVFTITATVEGNGGTISPGGTLSVESGLSQTFSFSAANGYTIAKVLVDGVNNEQAVSTGIYTFSNVTENHSLVVSFARLQYTLTASVNGTGGSISPNGATTVYHGDSKQYTITPNEGYVINQVLVDGIANTEAANTGTLTLTNITASHIITVSFHVNKFSIIASVYGYGATLTLSSGGNAQGETIVSYGESKTYTVSFSSPTDHIIDSVIIDGVNIPTARNTTGYTYTFSQIRADHTMNIYVSIGGIFGNDFFKWTLNNETLNITGIITTGVIPNCTLPMPWESLKSSIRRLTISDGVTAIGSNAFRDLPELVFVAIPNSVHSIGSDAFRNCPKIEVMELPNQIASIGDRAFYGCSKLVMVYCPKNDPPQLGINTFYGISATSKLYVPAIPVTSITNYKNSERWNSSFSTILTY
ncbi:MAG: leucine-rich repeat protein [Bacteroidales bacterium]|jgi:hypothetical protein|nr:leucine-rich repeat protein [Bacteroidales bacterium]